MDGKHRALSVFLVLALILIPTIFLNATTSIELPQKEPIEPTPTPEPTPIEPKPTKLTSKATGLSTKVIEEEGALVLSRWNGNGKLKINTAHLPKSHIQISKKKDKFDYDEYEVAIYPLGEGIEYEITLHKKPKTNIFYIDVMSENLEFYHQPPLNKSEYPKGWIVTETHAYAPSGKLIDYRPPDIVGSYAVYHTDKKDNEYKTGKFCHITRPKVISADGDWTWADLYYNASSRQLEITVNSKWLANAKYPVIIDPWFGYRVKGATETTLSDVIRATSYNNVYTMTVRGVVAYIKYNSEADMEFGVYNATTNALMGNTRDWESAPGWDNWKKLDADPTFGLTPGDYYLCIWTSGDTYMYYDSGGATAKYHTRTYDGNWPNPITWTSWADRRISIYADNTTLAAIPINIAAGIVNPEGCGNWIFQGGTLYNFRATYLCVDGADQIIETGIGFYDGINDWYAVYHNLTSDETSLVSPEDGIRAMQSNYTRLADTLTVDYWIIFDPPIADVINTPIYMYSLTNTTSTGWETPLAAAPGAGVSGFGYFKTIIANSLYVDSDLSNETVLVHLDATFEWIHVQADGDDVRFIDTNGTALSYELERWNYTNSADFWVRILTLDSEVDTMFIMFYGNPTAGSASNPEATWDPSYTMVQHLNDWTKTSNDNRTGAATGDLVDSTTNNNDGDLFWVSQTQLMGWWAFEDGDPAITVTDLSPNANTGTWFGKAVGETNYTASFDGLDDAGYFDGTQEYVDITDNPTVDINNTISVECWFKLEDTSSSATLVGKYGGVGQRSYLLYWLFAQKQVTFIISHDGTNVVNAKAPITSVADTWYHVVGVFNGTHLIVYLNGDPGTPTNSPGIIFASNANLRISRPTGFNFPWNGTIDEVRLYNRSLSAQEVQHHYRQWVTNSQIDGGLRFDGTDNHIDCGGPAPWNTIPEVTLQAWIKIDSFPTLGPIIEYSKDQNDEWGIVVRSAGGGVVAIHDDIDNANDYEYPTSINLGQWYKVDAVLDSLENLLYVNGTLAGSGQMATDNWTSFNGDLYVGQVLTNFFNGTIDEVRISNSSRSASQIKVDYYSESNQLLRFGVEREVIATVNFNIYNEGGQTEFATDGNPVKMGGGFRVSGGSVFDLAAQNSSLPGGSWARGNVTYRKFQHIRLLFHWLDNSTWDAAQSHWDCPSEHRNTGYVEFGVDYCHNDTWMEGWKCHMEIVDGRAGTGWAADASWVMLNVSWYNRGIRVKSDLITAYYESYQARDNATKFSLHVDLWVDRENASSMVGGRVNSEYFGMVQRGWFWWAGLGNWEPKKAQQEKSFYQDDLLGYGYRTVSAKDITLFKIWAEINKTAPDGAGVPTCDSHQWAITEYEARHFQWCYADEPMRGISEPLYTKTQVITLAVPNMFAALVTALIDGITRPLQQVLYETAPSAGRSFMEIVQSSFRAIGERTGLSTIYNWRSLTTQFRGYIGFSFLRVGEIFAHYFALILRIGGFVISWFGRIINTFVRIINIVVAILRGTSTVGELGFNVATGVGDIISLMNLNAWIDAVPIFMIVAWFLSIDNRAKTFGGWMSIFWGDLQIIISVISFFLDIFMQVINFVLDFVFKMFDRLPITGDVPIE